MYEFLKKNFGLPVDFIGIASKTAHITWSLSSGEVIKADGLHLIPGLIEISPETNRNDKLNIFQIIPKSIYVSIWKKADYFFSQLKRNTEKKYLLVFSLKNYINPSSLMISIRLNDTPNITSLTIINLDAIDSLNDQIMIIAEVISENNTKIIGAISLPDNKTIFLKNYEFEILQLLSQGYQSESISILLCLSKHTVDDIRKELLNKFQAKNIYQLIANAYQESFI